MRHYKHQELTQEIINAFYKVYNTLGYGFLEKVYENALILELNNRGFKTAQQAPITVFYESEPVGHYFADVIVNDLVILEIKTSETIAEAHKAQLLNYLRSTNIEVGLVLNFGPKPESSRKIYQSSRKRHIKS